MSINALHVKSGLRVVLKWKIFRPDSVIAAVIRLHMKTYENNMGGTTTLLRRVDELSDLPDGLREHLAPELIRTFSDPTSITDLIDQYSTPASLRRYLRQLVDSDNWNLMIVDPNFPFPKIISGISVNNRHGASCVFHPQLDGAYPGLVPEVFSHFQWINWGGLGCSGQLNSESEWIHLEAMNFGCNPAATISDNARIFANTRSGDVMVRSDDGTSGLLSHEDGSFYERGTVPNMIDWIFDTLASGSFPEIETG